MPTKITPMLWFDTEAEEAAKFYTSIFRNSKITGVSRYAENMPMPKGTVLTVSFTLDGQEFTALNGGPVFKFTEAISLVVHCRDQKEIDHHWDRLLEGGAPSACGWLKDKFGVSWQVVPIFMMEMLESEDRAKTGRALQAMMQMVKFDLKKLEDAARG
ncbi:MAG TPA: VOC family protein [Dongiaceae bacterium]|nr:VOC family protein [Dongiaceae bacterium]